MRRLIRSLIRLGIFGGVLFLLMQSNPGAERHKEVISARVKRLAENDPLLNVTNLLHSVADRVDAYPYSYRDHRLYSMMKNGEETVSLGIAGRVYIFKQEFKSR